MAKYKAHAKFGQVYGDTLATPQGRFVWVYLVSPKDAPDPAPGEQRGKPKFETSLLLPKGDASIAPFVSKIDAMYVEMLAAFNAKRDAPLGKGSLFSDGDGDWVDHEKYPFYMGHWVLRATNADRPGIWDANKAALDPSKVHAGMIGRLVVTPMATSHGLRFKLTDVQMLKDDGTKYGGFSGNTASLLDAIGPESSDEDQLDPETAVLVDAVVQNAIGATAAVTAPPTAALEGKVLSPAEQAAARRAAAQGNTQAQRRAALDKL